MREWTKEQNDAIQDRNNNLLVAAAAGSGKTAVLVERIIQLIVNDKVDIDRMLIVTFTQAAAGEMRERISSALLTELEKDCENDEYLRSQINLLNRASISTLHAFCMDVVKRYFHLIDIDPNFRIGDTTETAIMRLEALEELLENEYEKNASEFIKLVEMFGGGKDDTPLHDLILRTYNFIQSKPEPLSWLQARAGDFKLEAEEFIRCPWIQSLTQQLQIELSGVRDIFCEALKITDYPDGPAAYQTALTKDLETVGRLIQSLEDGLFAFYEQLSQVQYSRLPRTSKDTSPILQEEVKGLRDQGKKIIKEIQSAMLFQNPEQFRRDLNELHPSIEYLYELVKAFTAGYLERKADKGIVDFNDLEHYALDILNDREAAGEYRRKYQYIFVDEYQDSNLVQETILNFIKREDNLFLVGDVKQSIYRFRLADPSLFLEKYEAFQNSNGSPDLRIDLSTNFRSRAEIIHGVNDIFSQIMSRDFGDIEYDEKVYLYPGLECPADMKEELSEPALELFLIDKNSNSLVLKDETEEEEEEASDIEVEARIAAARISELYGQSFYDSKQGCYRPLEYRDMVVLMRATRQQADVFFETFVSEGIPVYADVDRGYFQTLEINIFMNLLKLIDNKRQDIPLLSVLRSPIGKFTVDDLIAVRVGSHAATYYEAIQDYLGNNEDALQSRLQEFIDKLDSWKEKARYTNMDEFIWQLLLETGYYYYVGAMPGGLQRQANLRILLDRAKQFQATSLKGLFHFIKFVDKLQAGSGDMGMAKILGENENVVRIMSIHKSKGLEFPVVIAAGLGRGFNNTDTRAPVLFHKDLGIGPCYVNPELRITRDTIARIALKNLIKIENLAEEMRILYVACTRPRDKLILIGSLRDLSRRVQKWSKAVSPFQLARGTCHLDWIGPIVMRHPDGAKLRELTELYLNGEAIQTFDYHWLVKIISRSDTSLREQQEQENLNFMEILQEYQLSGHSPEREIIWQRLNWQYPFAEAVKIPSKLSVSQIKNLQARDLDSLGMNTTSMTRQPRFMETDTVEKGTRAITGPAKGTIMHFVMQHLDFGRVSSEAEIAEQIEEMVKKELLRKEEAAAVDITRVLKYFWSDLGQRVLRAPKVYREVPFNLICKAATIFAGLDNSSEELLLQGVIDLYFREGEELVLIDYKTDRITPNNRDELIEKYRIQVELYKTALEKIQGQQVKESYLYLFDCDEAVECGYYKIPLYMDKTSELKY